MFNQSRLQTLWAARRQLQVRHQQVQLVQAHQAQAQVQARPVKQD
jgi:hypothetical protein